MSGAEYQSQLRIQPSAYLLLDFNESIIVGVHPDCYGERTGVVLGKRCDE